MPGLFQAALVRLELYQGFFDFGVRPTDVCLYLRCLDPLGTQLGARLTKRPLLFRQPLLLGITICLGNGKRGHTGFELSTEFLDLSPERLHGAGQRFQFFLAFQDPGLGILVFRHTQPVAAQPETITGHNRFLRPQLTANRQGAGQVVGCADALQ